MASCGNDGKVNIFGFWESTNDQIVEFNKPIISIELESNFSRSFSFLTGDTRLILNKPRHTRHIIHDNEGIISNIKWCQNLIAWSNQKGVKIYSTAKKEIIISIINDYDENFLDDYRCILLWSEPYTLSILNILKVNLN